MSNPRALEQVKPLAAFRVLQYFSKRRFVRQVLQSVITAFVAFYDNSYIQTQRLGLDSPSYDTFDRHPPLVLVPSTKVHLIEARVLEKL